MFFRQLSLLLWKNFILLRRQPVRLALQLFIPLVLFTLLVWVKKQGHLIHFKECHYDAKPLPSAGPLPFLQGLLCTASNKCYQNIQTSEQRNQTSQFQKSVVNRLIEEMNAVLTNKTQIESLTDLFTDLTTLQKLRRLNQVDQSQCNFDLGGVTLNSTLVSTVLSMSNITSISQVVINRIMKKKYTALEMFELMILYEQLSKAETEEEQVEILRKTMCIAKFNVFDMKNHYFFLIEQNPELKASIVEICKLNNTEFFQFTRIILGDVSKLNIREQIDNCTMKIAGTVIKSDQISINNALDVITSLKDIQVMLQSLQVTINPNNPTSQDNATRSSTQVAGDFIAKFLCGRPELDIFSSIPNMPKILSGATQRSDAKANQTIEYDNSTTLFCNEIFADIQRTAIGRIVWRQLKPMIRGFLTFTPNTPIVRQIIKQANSTFENLYMIRDVAKEWLSVSPMLMKLMEDDETSIQFRDNLEVLSLMMVNSTDLKWLSGFFTPRANETSKSTATWKSTLLDTDKMMEQIMRYMDCVNFDKFIAFDTEEELVRSSMFYFDNNNLWAGLVFNLSDSVDNTTLAPLVSYKIRIDTAHVDHTFKFKVKDRYWIPGPRDSIRYDLKYVQYGFIYLQDMIDHAIIKKQAKKNVDIGINLQQFPYYCFIRDDFISTIAGTIPLFMTISWILSISTIVKNIVFEKEQRLKEFMKVMGLSNSSHWIASFITNLAVMCITIVMLIMILKIGKLLENSNTIILLLFMVSYGISTISLCFLISVFFDKANISSVCAGIFFFMTYLPYSVCNKYEEVMTGTDRAIASLLSNVAFGFGWTYISKYEQQGTGIQWEHLVSSPLNTDSFNIGSSILMMLLDAVLYMAIAFYVEAVWPGQYGMPHKWYFFVQRSYWCGVRYGKRDLDYDPAADTDYVEDRDNFETVSTISNQLGVKLVNLTKKYNHVKVIDSLALNFYQGHITSFLGHNGAGKTTTMSILTGLFPASSGTAYIYGMDINKDMKKIRKIMGVCPQYNILFNMLTVEEHLWFYSKLKGMANDKVAKEITKFLADIGLEDKRNELSKNLSGGMKRKLSIAMAFISESKLVILDEPTAGVDPYSRKSIWDLLLKFKNDRTIILTTHHMDEADVLSDRIAIVSHGKLCCYGSSLYLKSRFGSGYYLTLSRAGDDGDPFKDPKLRAETLRKVNADNDLRVDERITDGTAVVFQLINKYLPDARVIEDVGSEVTFQLTKDMKSDTLVFSAMFGCLDLYFRDLGFTGYGLSDTSLEEVFLKVIDDNDLETLERYYDENAAKGFGRASLRNKSDAFKRHKASNNKALNTAERRKKDQQNYRGNKTDYRGNKTEYREGETEYREGETDYREGETDYRDGSTINKDGDTYMSSDGDYRDANVEETEIIFEGKSCHKVTGFYLLINQCHALTVKRFHFVRRSMKSFVSQLLLPILFVCIAMIFAKLSPEMNNEPPMEIHPWYLTDTVNNLKMFYSNDNKDLKWTKSIDSLITKEDYGIGNRCLKPGVHEIKGFECKKSKSTKSFYSKSTFSNSTKECDCSSGFMKCPKDSYGSIPESRILATTDQLYNLTSRNISDWIVKTTIDYRLERFGGLTYGEENNMAKTNSLELALFIESIASLLANTTTTNNTNRNTTTTDPMVNSTLNPTTFVTAKRLGDDQLEQLRARIEEYIARVITKYNAKVWFNNKGYISVVAYTNIMNNAILRSNLPPGEDPSRYGIVTVNHPMNRTRRQLTLHLVESSAVDILLAISMIIAMSFIPATFILFLTEERASSSKLMQFVSGVRPFIYWLATFTWDMTSYLFTAGICLFIFYVFQIEAFVSNSNFGFLALLLILYGYAITPLIYLCSRFFTIPSSSFVTISSLNVFIGIISTVCTFIMDNQPSESVIYINRILKNVFLIFPQYCLGRGLIDMTANQVLVDTMALYGEDIVIDPFEWWALGRNLAALSVQSVLSITVVILMEYNFVPGFVLRFYYRGFRSKKLAEEDVDVRAERNRILQGRTTNDSIVIKNLSKMYYGKKKYAVNKLCFGVKKGECFGLLGVNGAGKTTTFKMLTGDISVSSGDAQLSGHSILSDIVSVHKQLGYCPQFDALCPLLSTREHLYLYARLHGLYGKYCDRAVMWALKRFDLYMYRNHTVQTLSGGNKRKLSTAIALVGNPQVVFLDEPTTGMDPKARRFIWKCIGDITKAGRSVILTSHSMEECEALCNRIAIMVNGQFKCIGSVQHLKNRFGNGYTVMMHLSSSVDESDTSLSHFMADTFPACVQRQKHSHMIEYELGSKEISLSWIFKEIEANKDRLRIDNYSVFQTTLDQVFVNFANNQNKDVKVNNAQVLTNQNSDYIIKFNNCKNIKDGVYKRKNSS